MEVLCECDRKNVASYNVIDVKNNSVLDSFYSSETSSFINDNVPSIIFQYIYLNIKNNYTHNGPLSDYVWYAYIDGGTHLDF